MEQLTTGQLTRAVYLPEPQQVSQVQQRHSALQTASHRCQQHAQQDDLRALGTRAAGDDKGPDGGEAGINANLKQREACQTQNCGQGQLQPAV